MYKQIKCPKCRSTYADDEDKCPYCHAPKPSKKRYTYKPVTINNNNANEKQSSSSSNKTNDVDIVLLVVLAVIFWPAAIIYFLSKTLNNKK